MRSRKPAVALSLLIAATAARADSGWPSEGSTWILLVIGMVAIGLYAATRMHRD